MSGGKATKTGRATTIFQKGGVMVFVAASLVVLVTFLAYVIDLGALVLANERARQYARFAAMAAIEGYFSKICDDPQDESMCYGQRLDAAEKRANDVSKLNSLFNTDKTLEVKRSDEWSDELGKAKLIPGNWWTAPATPSNTNPCNDNYPCFVDATEEPAPKINAFRVEEVNASFGGGITGFFAGLFGNDLLKLSAAATATVVPRRGMVMVDISGSTTRETHLKNDAADPPAGNGAKKSKYAFEFENPSDTGIFNALTAERLSGELTEPTVHYKSDYATIIPFEDDDYNPNTLYMHPDPSNAGSTPASYAFDYGVPLADRYLIDAFRDNNYQGPQPFQTILEGVKHLVAIFNERAVAGDKLGVVFYDDKLLWPRVLKPTNEFPYILELLDNSTISAGSIIPPDDVSDNTDLPFVRAAKHWLFPLKGSGSNTQLALMAGLSLLYADQQPGVITSDFLVNISDGRTICFPTKVNQNGNPTTPYYTGQPTTPDWTFWQGIPAWECSDDYVAFRDSVKALQAFLRTMNESGGASYKKLPIHSILVGRDSGPNTVDIAKTEPDVEPAECYTDAEIRRIPGQAQNAVLGSEIKNDDEGQDAFAGSDPFYEASYQMYQIALESGGLWLPIRPARDSETDQCDDPACTPGKVRVLDPKCRSVENQIKDAMEEIMGQSPYAIVEVE
jgi:hypothetical protein